MSNEIKYPNGKSVLINYNKSNTEKDNNIITIKKYDLTKAKLGVDFEAAINNSNEYYLFHNIAAIYKKPTPIQIVKVDYPSRNKAKITEAYYRKPSTTDYNGIYREKYIDFEAKSCKEMLFSFERIYPHQIEHLNRIKQLGGISFLIIEFSSVNEVYILPTEYLVEQYELSKNDGRKSISYEFFKLHGTLVERGINPELKYLKAVDEIFF